MSVGMEQSQDGSLKTQLLLEAKEANVGGVRCGSIHDHDVIQTHLRRFVCVFT